MEEMRKTNSRNFNWCADNGTIKINLNYLSLVLNALTVSKKTSAINYNSSKDHGKGCNFWVKFLKLNQNITPIFIFRSCFIRRFNNYLHKYHILRQNHKKSPSCTDNTETLQLIKEIAVKIVIHCFTYESQIKRNTVFQCTIQNE